MAGVAHCSSGHEQAQYSRVCYFHLFLASKGSNYSELIYLHCSWYCACVAVVNYLTVQYLSADYIFWSFNIIEFIFNHFENRVLFKAVLAGGRYSTFQYWS